MKMQLFYKIINIKTKVRMGRFLMVCSCLILLFSCQKELKSTRSMQVINGSIQLKGGTEKDTSVTLFWSKARYSKNSDITYTVQVSIDPTFQRMPKDSSFSLKIKNVDSLSLGAAQIIPYVPYYARVKADSAGLSTESDWVTSPKFLIGELNLFKSIKDEDIINKAAIIRWVSSPNVTSMTVTDSITGSSNKITFTDDEVENASKKLEDLQPNTTYLLLLYQGKTKVGTTSFTTKPAIKGNIIDLSEIKGKPDLLNDKLASNFQSGSVILLRRGETYTFNSSFLFNKSVIIRSKPGFEKKAYIKLIGYSPFDFVAGSQIDSIIFNDVKITADYQSSYIMNISNLTEVGKIKLKSCNLSEFRGVVRIKSSNPINIKNFVIEDCVVDSVRGYGVLNVDNSSAHVENIKFKNSTITNANRVITSKTSSQSVLIENCTFYNTPTSGRYMMEYGSNNVDDPVKVLNCLFAKATDVRGVSVGSNTDFDVTNCYMAQDYNGMPFPDVETYEGSSTQLFKDPVNENFTLIDSKLTNVGDPRWIP